MEDFFSSIIKLSPGFKTAVNIKNDLNNFVKSNGYIVTDIASDVILDLANGIRPTSPKRARLITGTYGTGKSHLGLVLTNIYKNSLEHESVHHVIERMEYKWPGKYNKLLTEKENIKKPFLIVLLYGDEGDFDNALLRALDRTINNIDELKNIIPDTTYKAAIKRIDELEKEYKDTFDKLVKLVEEKGLISIESLKNNLEKYNEDVFNKFCEIHKEVCSGAPFFSHHLHSPAEIFLSMSKKIISDHGYAGIVVFWDEFGRYMDRLVQDPNKDESLEIQNFAECCNDSEVNQCHLYLICHRSLKEYVVINNMRHAINLYEGYDKEIEKVSGRFEHFNLKSNDNEIFELMDQVIIQNEDSEGWKFFRNNNIDYLESIAVETIDLDIFPDFTKEEVLQTVVLGSYPLHPLAAYCLPQISQKVAQNERTMFNFLSYEEKRGSFGEYLNIEKIPKKNENVHFFTLDLLWDYFSDLIETEITTRKIASDFKRTISLITDSDLEKKIIKVIGILTVVSSDRFMIDDDIISFSLNIPKSKRDSVRNKLNDMSTGKNRILLKSKVSGSYKFSSLADPEEIETKVNDLIKERKSIIQPLVYLKRIWDDLELPRSIPATAYNDDFRVQRELLIDIVKPSKLDQMFLWEANINKGEFYDGYAIFILSENQQELNEAKIAVKLKSMNPQIILGFITETIDNISYYLYYHEALCYLGDTQSNVYGPGAELFEIWEIYKKDITELIKKLLKPIFDPENDKVKWYNQTTEYDNIISTSKLRNLASDILRKVYKYTPIIIHDRLVTDIGIDSLKKNRIAIIDKILKPNGGNLLSEETQAVQQHIIKSILENNSILKKDKNACNLEVPDENINLSMNKVLTLINGYILNSKERPLLFKDLIDILRSAPYGLKLRCIGILLAVVLRNYIKSGNINLDFKKTKTLSEKISKIDGEIIEDTVVNSEKYTLNFNDIGKPQEIIINSLINIFMGNIIEDGYRDKIVIIKDAIKKWWFNLPVFARNTNDLSEQANTIKEKLFLPLISETEDYHNLILNKLIDLFSLNIEDPSFSIILESFFNKIKNEFEDKNILLINKIYSVIKDRFKLDDLDQNDNIKNILLPWYKKIPSRKQNYLPGGDADIIMKICISMDIISLENFIYDIMNLNIDNWDDTTINRFDGRLEGAINQIENTEPPAIVHIPEKGFADLSLNSEVFQINKKISENRELSKNGEALFNIIINSIKGVMASLPDGEVEFIILKVLKELFFK